jgi:DNA (cytosine-5)-methyltransferase 1
VMWQRDVWTGEVAAKYEGPRTVLGDVLIDDGEVPPEYFIAPDRLKQWAYLKGAKREERTSKSGHRYAYAEGAIAFPDRLDVPARTILTGEGGSTPSRFKHIIRTQDGRYRRLVPIELERLNGFPDGWTDTGMPDGRRAFMMGNALVVGLVAAVGGLVSHAALGTTKDLRVISSV